MHRLVVALLCLAVGVVSLGPVEAARGASVSLVGSQIRIVFTSTGSTAESLSVFRSGPNWTFSGSLDGGSPSTIPMASSCDIAVSSSGNGTNQTLFFGPSGVTLPDCQSAAFKFRTAPASIERLDLSGDINVQASGGSFEVNSPTTLVADVDLRLYSSDTIDFQGTVDGAHALRLNSGTVRLAADVGTTTPVSSLTIGDASPATLTQLGRTVVTSGAQSIASTNVQVSGLGTNTQLTASSLAITGDVTSAAGAATTLQTTVTADSTISGVISDASGTRTLALDKRGSGRLTLTGGTNTYTGSTTVTAGTLIANTSGSLGGDSGGTSVESGATLQFNAIGGNTEPITLAGGSTLAAAGGSVSSLTGAITLESGAQTVNVASGAVLVLGGGVNGRSSGRGAITATGIGRITVGSSGIGLTTPIASFASSTSGALWIGGNITATGAVTLDGAVKTYAAAVTVTGAPVSGSGTIDNGNGSSFSTLTLDSGTEPNALSGAIGSGAGDASKLNLVLVGSSSHTLSATTSGFVGSLTVQSGGLIVSGTLTQPSATTVASGAAVSGAGTGTIGSPVSFPSGSWGFGIGNGYPYLLTVGTVSSSTVAGGFNVVVDGTTPGTGYTKVVSTGSVNLSGLNVWSDGFDAPLGTVITPLSTASGITGTLTGHPEGSIYHYWRISYAANGGKDMTWTFVGMAPQPTAVSPSTSSTAGGGTLTITGGPLYDGTQVTVGGAPCTSPTRISDSELRCTLPPHAAGVVDVVVTNTDRSATLTGAVTYTAPSVTAATPETTRTLAIGTPRVVGTKLVTTITAPGAGAITQTAVSKKGRKSTTRCRVRQSVNSAGDLTITCSLNARARAALRRAKLRLTVTTTFTPTGGKATTRVAKVTAKRKATGKRALLL